MNRQINRARVESAMNALRPYLSAYVARHLTGVSRARRSDRDDISGCVAAIMDNWDVAFASELSRTVKNYIHELRDIRNRWAHQEEFDDEETERAVDTIRLIARAIEAPASITT